MAHKGKKTLYWYSRYGRIEVEEQIYWRGGKQVRSFATSAGVVCRGYSLGLQRAMTDFGADKAFVNVPKKLKEHYGIEVPISMARVITERHGQIMKEKVEDEMVTQLPKKKGVEQLIVEMDGSMLPVVEIEEKREDLPSDGRKRRKLDWREVRLCMARDPRKLEGHYGGTMGGPQEAGAQMVNCVVESGGGKATKLHCVGDGALWIVGQVKNRFGEQANYTVDFHHVSEYLAAAGEVLAGEQRKEWLHHQQQRMKESRVSEVLNELAKNELPNPDPNEAVTTCSRYLSNRLDCLDYKGALEAGLPIGSGEIESGHGWVFQDRLKLSGAWWKPDNLQKMMALRLVRANNQWESYWECRRQAAA